MNRIRIRDAIEDDAQSIAAVAHALGELTAVAGRSVESTAHTIELNLKRMASSGSSTAYVAENAKDEIVGYCAVHWVPFLFLEGGEAYVTELFVRPDASGKGIGSALLETVVAEAKRRNCSRVSLLNGRDGQSYQRNFYMKRGWVERVRMANFILPLAKEPNGQTKL
jgi:GNAT superfamily N-acetyltransferase